MDHNSEILMDTPKIFFPAQSIFNEMKFMILQRRVFECLANSAHNINRTSNSNSLFINAISENRPMDQTINICTGNVNQISVQQNQEDRFKLTMPGNSIFDGIEEFIITNRGHEMLTRQNLGLTANNNYNYDIYFKAYELLDGRVKLKRFSSNDN